MGRWIALAAGALVLAGCGTFDGMVAPVPDREVFGVLAPQSGPAETTELQPDAAALLDRNIAQICTGGAEFVREEVVPAENERQIADREIRCAPYRLSVFGWSLAGLVPPMPF